MPGPKKKNYYNAIRSDVADLIGPQARSVLDVGCAEGLTGELLKKKGVKEVIGLEIDQAASKIAETRLDKVLAGDVQKMVLPFKEGYFDCIIYADVLEHLIDPWMVLREQKRFLNDKGIVVASLPNVGHYRVVKKLLKGKWDYEERGVMDATHLRFFTLDGIKKMFDQAGYRIDEIVYKISASRIKKFMNKLFKGRFNESLCEQFIIKATKV